MNPSSSTPATRGKNAPKSSAPVPSKTPKGPPPAPKMATTLSWKDIAAASSSSSASPPIIATPSDNASKIFQNSGEKPDWKAALAPPVPRIHKKRAPITLGDVMTVKVVSKTQPATAAAKKTSTPPPPKRMPNSGPPKKGVIVNPATGISIEKRGKERKDPKPKKPSRLKMSILEERQDAWFEENAETSEGATLPALPVTTPSKVSKNKSKRAQAIPTTERDVYIAQMKALPKAKISSGRTYLQDLITEELNQQIIDLLTQLYALHQKAKAYKQTKPSKAKRGRRLVLGLREVARAVLLKKAKFVVIAPNIEDGSSQGGLDDTVRAIIEAARARRIPVIFALSRRKLGEIVGSTMRMSAIAVVSVDGGHEQYVQLLASHERLRILSAVCYKRHIASRLAFFALDTFSSTPPAKQKRLPSIDRLALVDSRNPLQILTMLGPRRIRREDADDTPEWHTVEVDLARIAAAQKEETLHLNRISLRALTSPDDIGSIVWHLELTSPADSASNAAEQETRQAAEEAASTSCLISQSSPHVLLLRQGKYVRPWHPTQDRHDKSPLTPQIQGQPRTFSFRLDYHSELDGHGPILDTLRLKLTVIYPSLPSNLATDPSDDQEYASESQEVLLPMEELSHGALHGTDDGADSSSSEEDSESEESPSTTTPIAMQAESSATAPLSSTVLPPPPKPTQPKQLDYALMSPEELEAAEAEIRREKRAQKRARLLQRLHVEQELARQQEAQNAINREKHRKQYPGLPKLEDETETVDYFAYSLTDLLTSPKLQPAATTADPSDAPSWTLFVKNDESRSPITHIVECRASETVKALAVKSAAVAQLSLKHAHLSFLGVPLDPSALLQDVPLLEPYCTLNLSSKKQAAGR